MVPEIHGIRSTDWCLKLYCVWEHSITTRDGLLLRLPSVVIARIVYRIRTLVAAAKPTPRVIIG